MLVACAAFPDAGAAAVVVVGAVAGLVLDVTLGFCFEGFVVAVLGGFSLNVSGCDELSAVVRGGAGICMFCAVELNELLLPCVGRAAADLERCGKPLEYCEGECCCRGRT